MTRERLGKLEKIILTVLKASEEADKAWYNEHRPGCKPPFPHKIRDMWGTEDHASSVIEEGIKIIVEKFLKKQMGVEDSLEKIIRGEYKPCSYFDKSMPTGKTSRYGSEITRDISPFNASFSRSLKSLISKGYIEATKTIGGKQIESIKLTEKGLNVKFHKWNLTLRKQKDNC